MGELTSSPSGLHKSRAARQAGRQGSAAALGRPGLGISLEAGEDPAGAEQNAESVLTDLPSLLSSSWFRCPDYKMSFGFCRNVKAMKL